MLPSQSPRTPSRRASTRRRRRLGRRLAGLLILAVVATGLTMWTLGSGGEEQPGGTEGDQARAEPAGSAPAPGGETSAREQELVAGEPEPVEIAAPAPPALGAAEPAGEGTNVQETEDDPAALAMGGEAPERPLGRPESLADAPATTPAPTPAPADPAPAVTGRTETAGSTDVSPLLTEGRRLLATGRPVEARRLLSDTLRGGQLDGDEAAAVREELTRINERLVFSPEIVEGDPFVTSYVIEAGDSLSKIVGKLGLQVDWRFIQRINQIQKASGIRGGQRIKVVTGPFHAVVDKKDFRLDLYLGSLESSSLVYVRSFAVGLGEHDSTPIGMFRVRPQSKLVDPAWTNPRTGEHFAADDPMNPIGDRWIGLQGLDETIKDLTGYGLHGTIEPESIGREASMGCVRMREDDVAIVYECLTEGVSRVQIVRDY